MKPKVNQFIIPSRVLSFRHLFLIILFYSLLSIIAPTIVYGKNIAIFVMVNKTSVGMNITPVDSNIFIPKSEWPARYSLRLYNSLDQETLRINFNNFTFLIIPYDLNQNNKLRIFYRYYMIYERDLEMCNHNNICEENEIDCDDCKISQSLLNLSFENSIIEKRRNNFIPFLILISFIVLILIFIINKLNNSLNNSSNYSSNLNHDFNASYNFNNTNQFSLSNSYNSLDSNPLNSTTQSNEFNNSSNFDNYY